MRTKWCTRLNEKNTDKVIDVKTIFITAEGKIILCDLLPKVTAEASIDVVEDLIQLKMLRGLQIPEREEKDVFAWADGFRLDATNLKEFAGSPFALMLHFWKQTHQLPFVGTVTYW